MVDSDQPIDRHYLADGVLRIRWAHVNITINNDGTLSINVNDEYYSTTLSKEVVSEIVSNWKRKVGE